MEHSVDPATKYDHSKGYNYEHRAYCDESEYPSSVGERIGPCFRVSEKGIGSTTQDSAESSKESENDPERLGLVNYDVETDWEDENSRDFEAAASASPPPKRKRPAQVALHGLRTPVGVDYALVEKAFDLSNTWIYQGTENVATEGEQGKAPSNILEQQSEAVTRPARSQRRHGVLHNGAMILTFMAIVSLWGTVDKLIEVISGDSNSFQFQLYALLLLIGAVATLGLRKLKATSCRGTFYPTLLSSLLTAAGGWGLVDVAVEIAAGGGKSMMLLSYFVLFLATGFLVVLYVVLVDGGFSEVLGGLI